eukprot:4824722-Prymnesium_polylepis.1
MSVLASARNREGSAASAPGTSGSLARFGSVSSDCQPRLYSSVSASAAASSDVSSAYIFTRSASPPPAAGSV